MVDRLLLPVQMDVVMVRANLYLQPDESIWGVK